MDPLIEIEKNYKTKSDGELKKLVNKPFELRLDVIPVLQKELLNRGLQDEAMALTQFLLKSKKEGRALNELSKRELLDHVNERIESGEPLDNIKDDLRLHGIDVFEVFNDEGYEEKAMDYITDLKLQGLKTEEIDQKLQETLSIDKQESALLRAQLRKRGNQNLVVGYTMVIIALILIVLSAGYGGSVTVGGVLIICFGVWRIVAGYEQIKKDK